MLPLTRLEALAVAICVIGIAIMLAVIVLPPAWALRCVGL